MEVLYSPLDFWPIMRRAYSVIRPIRVVLVEAEVLRWLLGLFGLLGSTVVLMWLDGELWGLLGIGAMLRLLRALLWIRRLPW